MKCDHDYRKLGYLMVYASEEFSPVCMIDDPRIAGSYDAYRGVARDILVYQCVNCGDIKLTNGILDKIFSPGRK